MKPSQLTDELRLVSATRNGRAIPVYCDGFGTLWIHRDSLGISGIVRAVSLESAYGICEDEFFPEATETVDELRAEYGFDRRHVKIVRGEDGDEREARPEDYGPGGLRPKFVRWQTIETPSPDAWSENELFHEAYGFRPSGHNSADILKHGIYQKDLNGDYLDPLTDALAAQLGIELTFEPWH